MISWLSALERIVDCWVRLGSVEEGRGALEKLDPDLLEDILKLLGPRGVVNVSGVNEGLRRVVFEHCGKLLRDAKIIKWLHGGIGNPDYLGIRIGNMYVKVSASTIPNKPGFILTAKNDKDETTHIGYVFLRSHAWILNWIESLKRPPKTMKRFEGRIYRIDCLKTLQTVLINGSISASEFYRAPTHNIDRELSVVDAFENYAGTDPENSEMINWLAERLHGGPSALDCFFFDKRSGCNWQFEIYPQNEEMISVTHIYGTLCFKDNSKVDIWYEMIVFLDHHYGWELYGYVENISERELKQIGEWPVRKWMDTDKYVYYACNPKFPRKPWIPV